MFYTKVRKQKEVLTDETKKYHTEDMPAYPGAANKRYFIQKGIEAVTALASGMGVLTVLIFFLML